MKKATKLTFLTAALSLFLQKKKRCTAPPLFCNLFIRVSDFLCTRKLFALYKL